jgi:hypothetical protein
MSKTLKYVKEFDFGPQMTYVKGYARGGKCKTDYAMGGSCYAEGGKTDLAQDKAMIKKAFKQHDMQEHKGGKGTTLKLKKGGKAMMKHKREETPTMGALGMIANKNPGERRGVPVAPNTPMITPMKKGGAVPKAGQYKVGKVMGEFKKGELHSGSKNGPEVTNPKQAVAIALSEARNAGKKRK